MATACQTPPPNLALKLLLRLRDCKILTPGAGQRLQQPDAEHDLTLVGDHTLRHEAQVALVDGPSQLANALAMASVTASVTEPQGVHA